MTQVGKNSLDTRSTLTVGGKSYAYYSLKKAAEKIGDVSRLPFSMKVLLARIGTVLRRVDQAGEQPTDSALLKAGPLSIDTSRHEVAVNGEAVKLTLTEFKLLAALVGARGRVLTRDQLMDKAMGTDVFVTDRAIDVHVTAIRKKLGTANRLIHTVRGVGYRLQETPEDGE